MTYDLSPRLFVEDGPAVSAAAVRSSAHHRSWRTLDRNRRLALIADQVIGDFRAPDVIRFGLTPLYLGFEDLWHAVERMAAILETGRWREPRFSVRGKVT